jgi:hypothetical protein
VQSNFSTARPVYIPFVAEIAGVDYRSGRDITAGQSYVSAAVRCQERDTIREPASGPGRLGPLTAQHRGRGSESVRGTGGRPAVRQVADRGWSPFLPSHASTASASSRQP